MKIVYYNITKIGFGNFKCQKLITNNLVFWIIFYLFLLTNFFLHVVQFQMIWNFLGIYPIWLEKWIQRLTTILDFFQYKSELLKCNCPDFCRDIKLFFDNSNTNIMQSRWWKILKFLTHLFKPEYYKIL